MSLPRYIVLVLLALLACVSARFTRRRNQPFISLNKQQPFTTLKGRRPLISLKGQRPNILLIVADDLGHNDVGYNNPKIQTPTITRLAKGGVILNSHYAYPTCTPSRAALLTGKYTHRIGMQQRPLFSGDMVTLPLNIPLLPQELKTVGYSTHMIGKWHLGQCSVKGLPTNRGFDDFFGFLGGSVDYYNKTQSYSYVTRDLFEDEHPFTDDAGEYIEDMLLSRAKNAIRRSTSSSNPFFLVYSTPLPHNPQQVPNKFITSDPNIASERRIYLGMLSALDNSVKELEQTLIETGKMKNTVIILISDNGALSDTIRLPRPAGYDPTFYKNFYGPAGSNYPYRSGKSLLYEGGIRTPAFIYSPLLPSDVSGTSRNGLFHITDWMPTILNWAGISSVAQKSCRFNGVDQTALLSTPLQLSARRHAILSIQDLFIIPPKGTSNSTAAIRSDRYKYTRGILGLYHPIEVAAGLTVFENQWTQPSEWQVAGVTKPQISGTKCGMTETDECLFDLISDPSETVNLLEKTDSPFHHVYGSIAKRLKDILNREPIVPPVTPNLPVPHLTFPNGVLVSGYCDSQIVPAATTCTLS